MPFQSCAATLAQHPKDFDVTVLERLEVTGGQATSISLDKEKYGTTWMNNGVQGGSPVSPQQPPNPTSLKPHRYSNTSSTSSENIVTHPKKSNFKYPSEKAPKISGPIVSPAS